MLNDTPEKTKLKYGIQRAIYEISSIWSRHDKQTYVQVIDRHGEATCLQLCLYLEFSRKYIIYYKNQL